MPSQNQSQSPGLPITTIDIVNISIGIMQRIISEGIEGVDDRSIPKPKKPSCGCTCNCRADANDNIPGNILPGENTFVIASATADNCAKATKDAKREATQALGKQPKHVGCRCSNK